MRGSPKKLNVAFVQLLEPKAVGHYEGKDVLLTNDHLDVLNKFYLEMNFNPAFEDFPIIVYHGYHQRTVGCLSGGNRMLYIDSEGYINACPFCHTKNWNIKDALETHSNIQDEANPMGCPQFQSAIR